MKLYTFERIEGEYVFEYRGCKVFHNEDGSYSCRLNTAAGIVRRFRVKPTVFTKRGE